MKKIEHHPFEPFLPPDAKVLLLGTFPPQPKRWSMEFYYPNFQNDMWRIMGVVFYGEKNTFVDGRAFDKKQIENFCREKGIAMYDTAVEICRLKDNASDKYLEVVKSTDIPRLLREIPLCTTVVTAGIKAASVIAEELDCEIPGMGDYSQFVLDGRTLRLYRLPSSSRAYPAPLEKKAAYYARMFRDAGLLQ